MSGKSYQVLFQHFYSMLPKVSADGMRCIVRVSEWNAEIKEVKGH